MRLWIFLIDSIFENPTAFTQIRTNRWRPGRKNTTNVFRFARLQLPLPMRPTILTSSILTLLLTGYAFGCAFEGTIVDKRSRQLPDTSMIGTEGVHSFAFRGPTGTSRLPVGVPKPEFWTENNGMYTFFLRDQAGHVRSQMVTAEVFARCRVGDYFNDRGPACKPPDSKDSKSVTTAVIYRRRNYRTAQIRRKHRKVAIHRRHHAAKSRKAITLRASRALPHG